MSLVHDALQKAEREKLRKTGQIAPPAAPVSKAHGGSGVPAAIPLPVAAGTPLPPQQPSRRRLRILPILIAALVAIAVGVFLWVVLRPRPASTGGPSRPGGIAASEGMTPADPTTSALRTPSERPPAETPPPAAAATDDPAYNLTGIMKDPDGKPCAIVNGRVVSEGHYVDGATVKKIERDRVTLDVNGREVVKRLY